VPQTWRALSPCHDQAAADFFVQHYAFCTYNDLARTLVSATLEQLDRSGNSR
jgi:hypothetical protein